MKELLYVALDIVLNAPEKAMAATWKAAIKVGATAAEVVEAVSLSLMSAGVPKYMSLGYQAIKTAVETEGKVNRKSWAEMECQKRR